jgi:hypothetical protein
MLGRVVFGDFERAKLSVWGRSFVPPEGRDEFSNPTYATRKNRTRSAGGAPPLPGSRHTGVKLVVMALVMIGILLAVIALVA